MICPSCHYENPETAQFCGECAKPLGQASSCPACSTQNPPGQKFCNGCGRRLAIAEPPAAAARDPGSYTPKHLAEKILISRSALEGERKTITALFADIKGSMELLEDLDPEEARRIIDPALQLMMDSVHRYEGYVAQPTGDGIFALFGAPIAHEDHPQRALHAALLMQEKIARYGDELRLDTGTPIYIRVGINTGEVVVRSIRKDDLHTDYAPVGHSTSLAARMEALAKPGSIIVSEYTHKLTEGYFQFRDLGPTKVKGVSQPVGIYEVRSVGPLRTRLQVAARRGLVRFVGRQRELEQMRRAWESARVSHGQIVAVMGEAGVGKSRLVYEFKAPVESQGLVLEAFSVSHGKAHPYLPLIDLLKTYFEITLQDDERKRREKVGGKVLMLDRTLEDTLPYLFTLLGIAEPTSSLAQMDPQIRRQRTLDAIKRLLVRESLSQPLLVIFEDLHWVDGETQAVLEALADSVATAKILLLVNYRPEYRHDWASKTYYTRLRLDPLGKEEADELLTALLGDGAHAGLQPLKQLILAKTEGNPFFTEELVKTLAEEHVLVGERGSYRLEKEATELHIPTTVQAVLAARIDRLPPDEKDFLQTLSVVGKEFPLGLLRKVTRRSEEELYRLLHHVQTGEFIYEQPAFPEPEYTFKHALTQEVAYQSLLVERRRELHVATAQAIEELYSHGLEEHYSELAHHYSRTDNTWKAVEYLHLAGRQALARSAFTEASRQVTTGLELLGKLPETSERDQQELLLQVTLGRALMVAKGYGCPEAEHAFVRAREICQQVGETPQLSQALSGLWMLRVVRAEFNKAHELAEELIPLAQRLRDPMALAAADFRLGATLFFVGEMGKARDHLERVVARYDARGHQFHSYAEIFAADPRVAGLSYTAWALQVLGYPDQSLKRSREALMMARELADPVSLAIAFFWAGDLCRARGEVEAAQEYAEGLVALSNEHGILAYSGLGTFLRAWARAERGQPEEAIGEMLQALEAFRATGAELAVRWSLGPLAEAYARAGKPEEGIPLIAEGLDVMHRTGNLLWKSHLHWLNGELLLAVSDDNEAEAEACFRRSLDTARNKSGKLNELKAATSLARLWQKQGKKKEARKLLSEIYGWFTEGFDTRDLKEAKALLDGLR